VFDRIFAAGIRRTIRRSIRRAAALSFCLLLLTTACKTSDDATAAAQQMSDTATALGDYYATLLKLVKETGQLNQVQEAMLSIPYGDADKKRIADAAAEIAKREEVAEGLSDLADSFTSLTTPDAATAASNSAASLQTEVDSIQGIGVAGTVVDALSGAMGTLVKALQEHKEREAARAMSSTIAALDAFFKKEMPVYESLDTDYLTMAQSLATNLVDRGQVDESYYVKDVLGPFDITPSVTAPDLKAKIDVLAKAHIAATAEERKKRFKKASAAMEAALAEMARRVDLVAGDKPMSFRLPPGPLTTVQQWIEKN
jgi:hypothetical protein